MTIDIERRRWPEIRATFVGPPPEPGAWTEPEPGTFIPDQTAPDWPELRYRHIVPNPEVWEAIQSGHRPEGPVRKTLITDFSSYNTDLAVSDRRDPRASRSWLQPHWVGDLTVSLKLTVRDPAGRLRLELIKGGLSNRCEIDLTSGDARLFHGDDELGTAATTRISQPGTYDLSFANVDGRLTLWVDRDLPFGDGLFYPAASELAVPASADLEPVRIAAQLAAIAIDGLILKRDIYYTLDPSEPDYANLGEAARYEASALFELLADPARFAGLASPPREFRIAPGHYMMLGDNSPWSSDGRAWGQADQMTRPSGSRVGRLGTGQLGGSRGAPDRQSVLRLLAPSQARLAQFGDSVLTVASRPSVHRADAMDSVKRLRRPGLASPGETAGGERD